MKPYVLLIMIFLLISCSSKVIDEYVIVDNSTTPTIYIDKNSDDLIKWAVKDLVNDLELITDKKIQLVNTDTFDPESNGIYIGEVSDNLVERLPENFRSFLNDQWEKFIIKKNNENLFIVGSDVRGTVYAIFELTKRIGVSPWKWWADVVPSKKEEIVLKLSNGIIEESPTVQYRGIFLNDEDWGLQPWAAKTFEPETGDIGPKTYEKIFQLLLRLKANTIWPAMHSCTKAFFRIPGNKEMAEKYHIVVGTSHAEPMLRNNVDEWDEKASGHFNYFENSEKVKEYWQERITEAKDCEIIITVGMRGIHDSGMEGNATEQEKVQLLENIISDQRKILSNTINKPIEEIPQVFTAYKEVLQLYNAGLKVPDDVTLMWTDDNYGYIRRLSNQQEQKRGGGSGVYYHVSYWGRPHDYLWLCTTQPALTWYEMNKAYQNGVRKIWIVNVGDIKPCEYNLEFFLDLAWNINGVTETTIQNHLTEWSNLQFGYETAEEIEKVMNEYYRLAFLRKPEYMGWSRTEPITQVKMTKFSASNENNEVQQRINAYAKLVDQIEQIKLRIPRDKQDAFFQLIEYPVNGAALMNSKFLYAQQSFLSTDDIEKQKLADKSQAAYDKINELTEKYNNEISGGKWKEMMSMSPRYLPVFDMPDYHLSNNEDVLDSLNSANDTKPTVIDAKEFTNANGSENYVWKAVDGLGYSNSAVTLFPFSNHYFKRGEPYLEYQFNIEEAGDYQIEIRCLPTHSNNFDHKVTVELNNNDKNEFNINTKGRSEAWKKYVLQNYVPIDYPVSIKNKGLQTLKIFVNQTGIVLDQILITPEN